MSDVQGTIRPIFRDWQTYNDAIVEVVGTMTDEQLAIRSAPDRMPIWAVVGHMAGMRVYWLCAVFGETGAETTPFPDPMNGGWEDDVDHPRSAKELVTAMETTWRVVDGCLGRWTLDMLDTLFVREMSTGTQHHSRRQILMRMLTHDAYHAGELSQTLGIHGLPQIDLWRPDKVTIPRAG